MTSVSILPLQDDDLAWVRQVLTQHWGSTSIVSRGVLHIAEQLPGFKALIEGTALGLLTYRIDKSDCEVVSLNSLRERIGIGTELMSAVRDEAVKQRCRRIWLITTNDNTLAISFYKKLGYRISAVHADAIKESRRLKPSIPLIGANGIEIRDEIEMELTLS
jgi:GNAT superfamily N-acetyltransferase